MSITRHTLELADQLRAAVNTHVDSATRDLVAAWVRAWNVLNNEWRAAIDEVLANSASGRWPNERQLLDIQRVQVIFAATTYQLQQLANYTGERSIAAATEIIDSTVFWQSRILSSQLPVQGGIGGHVIADRLPPAAMAIIVERTTQQIESRRVPLATSAVTAMRRSLIRGVALGENPRATAAYMMRATEGHFNGGLTRALNIARTETLDAYRQAAAAYQQQHRDVLAGWAWTAKLDSRTCPSCWAKHGSLHPLDEPGPHDHHQGRCARTPVTKSWAELGIAMPEPPSAVPDAEKRFWQLPRAEQLAIMGPARLQALEQGTLGWDQLSVNVTNPGWRDSWVPVSVRQVDRHVARASA